MSQAVQGADAKEEGIEEVDEDRGARPRIRHLGEGLGWDRGVSKSTLLKLILISLSTRQYI